MCMEIHYAYDESPSMVAKQKFAFSRKLLMQGPVMQHGGLNPSGLCPSF